LKTCCKHILLFLSCAEAITEAELAVAVVTCLLGGAGFQFEGGGLLRAGRVEGYDGTVAFAGAFAE
jgi:hypothetical protein